MTEEAEPQPQRSALKEPIRFSVASHCGAEGYSEEPEPLLPLPLRIASTTPKGHSATSARPASLGMPRRPRLLPAGPALARTSTPPAGRTQLRMGRICLGKLAVQHTRGIREQGGGRPGFAS